MKPIDWEDYVICRDSCLYSDNEVMCLLYTNKDLTLFSYMSAWKTILMILKKLLSWQMKAFPLSLCHYILTSLTWYTRWRYMALYRMCLGNLYGTCTRYIPLKVDLKAVWKYKRLTYTVIIACMCYCVELPYGIAPYTATMYTTVGLWEIFNHLCRESHSPCRIRWLASDR